MVAAHTGVAVVEGALLLEAVGLADRRIEVDRQGPGTGTGTRLPGAAEQLAADRVELPDVAPAEAAQERAHRRGGLDREAQDTSGATGAQGVHVVDVVAAGQGGHDQRQDLVADVGPTGLGAQVQVLVDQLLQTQVVGQRGRQDQARVGHQPVVVEGRIQTVEAVG